MGLGLSTLSHYPGGAHFTDEEAEDGAGEGTWYCLTLGSKLLTIAHCLPGLNHSQATYSFPAPTHHQDNPRLQGWTNVFFEGPGSNSFRLCGRKVSIAASPLCYCILRAAQPGTIYEQIPWQCDSDSQFIKIGSWPVGLGLLILDAFIIFL